MANDTLEGNRQVPRQAVRSTVLPDAVEGILADFLAAQIATMDAVDPALGGLARTTRDLVLAGGKRLRPTFAHWGWRGVADPSTPVDTVLPALAALELVHTFALVHDDVMDDSATRRGAPTAHRIFSAEHVRAARRGDPERFGSSAAILVGDLCLVWADQLLARTPVPAETLLAVRTHYDRMRVEAVAGQFLDVLGETQPDDWSVERALLVARHKTASYTVQRPLRFGLALAGPVDPAVDQAYARYGRLVGEAFQLRDDLLGAYGDPAVTGKPSGDDLLTGKPTALLMLARQLATPAQHAELARCSAGAVNPADGSGGPPHDTGHPTNGFGSPTGGTADPARNASHPANGAGSPTDGTADPARIAHVIAETGAPARVEAMIRERVAEAVAALAAAPIRRDAQAALIELAVRATQRPA